MAGPLHDLREPFLCALSRDDLLCRVHGDVSPPPVENKPSRGHLSLIIHANFLLLGFMVGAFGLLGGEVMTRRLGQASLLSYSARSLPLGERFIFANFVVKDTVYYFILWVFPFASGFMLASPFVGIPSSVPLLLTLTLTLSFLIGLSAIFFLSTVYVRSWLAPSARPAGNKCRTGRPFPP